MNFNRAVDDLEAKGITTIKCFGNSMTPIIKSGSTLLIEKTEDYKVGDVVLSKVKGNFYVHKITKIDAKGRYMISNNKGHDNGWTTKIFGKVMKVNDVPLRK